MNNIWNTLNTEQKNKFAQDYHYLCIEYDNTKEQGTLLQIESKKRYLEETFGKENLEKYTIVKTWTDLKRAPYNFSVEVSQNYLNVECLDKQTDKDILRKVQAVIQIAKLIEYGYGGRMKYDELVDTNIPKYAVAPSSSESCEYIIIEAHWFADSLPVFRTRRNAMDFLKEDTNKELLDNYFNS